MDNPYLDEFLASDARFWLDPSKMLELIEANDPERLISIANTRHQLVERYAFGIPDQAAVNLIADQGKPIVEMGAGSGYWAHLLSQVGAEITAYDQHACDVWHAVQTGTPELLADPRWSDHLLLLCWPIDDVGTRSIKAFSGDTVCYVGEWNGCTADEEFHDLLTDHWTITAEADLPQWGGIHDSLWILERAAA